MKLTSVPQVHDIIRHSRGCTDAFLRVRVFDKNIELLAYLNYHCNWLYIHLDEKRIGIRLLERTELLMDRCISLDKCHEPIFQFYNG